MFTSDLGRAVETAQLAFGGLSIPIFHDWRLRECNYGELNGTPVARLEVERSQHVYEPYPERGELQPGRGRACRASSTISLRGSRANESSSSATPRHSGRSSTCSKALRSPTRRGLVPLAGWVALQPRHRLTDPGARPESASADSGRWLMLGEPPCSPRPPPLVRFADKALAPSLKASASRPLRSCLPDWLRPSGLGTYSDRRL